MGFFKDFKEDLSQAVDELATDTLADSAAPDDDAVVDTLSDDVSEEAAAIEKESLKKVADEIANDGEFDLSGLAASMEESDKNNEEAVITAEDNKAGNKEETGVADASDNTDDADSDEEDEDDGSVAEETAIITKGLTVVGELNSRGSIDLLGYVEGNVTCRGKLTVSGSIAGNTKSMEIFANNARIDGNIETTGSVKIGQGTVVIGNINATSAVIAGAVKGDIDVHGPVIVDESAVIVGDIKSRTVQINNGATIDGRCSQCYAQHDINAIFDKKSKK